MGFGYFRWHRSAYWIYNGYQFNEEVKRVVVSLKILAVVMFIFLEDIYASDILS